MHLPTWNFVYNFLIDLFRCLILNLILQLTDLFLKGHSNAAVKIMGVRGNILDHIEIPDFVHS